MSVRLSFSLTLRDTLLSTERKIVKLDFHLNNRSHQWSEWNQSGSSVSNHCICNLCRLCSGGRPTYGPLRKLPQPISNRCFTHWPTKSIDILAIRLRLKSGTESRQMYPSSLICNLRRGRPTLGRPTYHVHPVAIRRSTKRQSHAHLIAWLYNFANVPAVQYSYSYWLLSIVPFR